MKVCIQCGMEFQQYHIINGKMHRLRNRTRCLVCLPLQPTPSETAQPKFLVKCKNCGKEIERSSENGNYFCTKTCAATHNNKKFPKRKKLTKPCKICGCSIWKRYTFCEKCKVNASKIRDILNHPLSFFIEKRKDAARYAQIRDHARKVTASRLQKCTICGYTKHVETAHKKEIQDFPLTALVSEINHPDNLIILCKNHHWEMDHNLLDAIDLNFVKPSNTVLPMHPAGLEPAITPL